MGFSWAKLLFWKTSTLPEKPYFLSPILAKVLYEDNLLTRSWAVLIGMTTLCLAVTGFLLSRQSLADGV